MKALTELRRTLGKEISPKGREPQSETDADPLRAEELAGAAGSEEAARDQEADVLPYPDGDAAEA